MKAKRIFLISLFLFSMLFAFLVTENQATAPAGWQCEITKCDNICWCDGSLYIKYDDCCLYCYNVHAGGWLDCCNDTCFPK